MVAGVAATVTIQLRNDKLINLIAGAANGGTWGALTGSLSGSGGTQVALSGTDNADGTYSVALSVTRAGSYTLALSFRGVAITGSTPISISVVPAAVSPATTTCTGQGMSGGSVGRALVYQISPADSFGNLIGYSLVGSGLFTASVSRGSAAALPSSLVYLESLSGKYEVSYTLTASGTYGINVLLLDSHVSGSPFSIQMVASDAVAVTTTASGSGLSSSEAGKLATFSVLPRDMYGNSLAETALQQYSLAITGPQTASITRSTGSLPFGFSYTVTTAGIFRISITLSSVHIVGSPFVSTVSPISTSPLTTGIVDSSVLTRLQAFVPFSLQLQAKDAYGNNRTVGGDAFTVDMGGIAVALSDARSGIYTMTGSTTRSAAYSLSVSLGGVSLSNFPVSAFFQPGPPSRSDCVISGSGLSGTKVSVPVTVSIISRDAAKSVRTSGSDLFLVLLSSSGSASIQTGCSWVRASTRYDCTYTATVAATYSLSVFLNSISAENVVGSPVSVVIRPGSVTAKGTTAISSSFADGIVAGSREVTTIQSGDDLGNKGVFDPFADDVFYYTASVTNSQGATLTSKVTNNLDATFSLAYAPTSTGIYSVSVFWNGLTHISGSPFSVRVLSADVDPSSCVASGAGLSASEAGKVSSFSVSTRDRFGNAATSGTFSFTAKFSKAVDAGQTQVTLPDAQTSSTAGSASFSYTAFSAGSWFVAVSSSVTGIPISGSPFSFNVNPTAVSAARCTAEGGALVFSSFFFGGGGFLWMVVTFPLSQPLDLTPISSADCWSHQKKEHVFDRGQRCLRQLPHEQWWPLIQCDPQHR